MTINGINCMGIKKLENVQLLKATLKHYELLLNLSRYYIYDMSKHCSCLNSFIYNNNNNEELVEIKKYFNVQDSYAFLIKIDQEIGGFILIDKNASALNIDWDMGEFFILGKFQKRGLGQKIANLIFKKFPGRWEVSVLIDNISAKIFWEKVIKNYTNNCFISKPSQFRFSENSPIQFMFSYFFQTYSL